MAITVTPTLPVIAATPSAAAPVLALQSGTVVNATVLNTLAENLVQIAIAGLSIDVLSEVPLQAGQTLRLAVSQTNSGIRLSIVPGGSQAPAGTSLDTVTLTANAPVAEAASPPVNAAASIDRLTPLERAAIAVASETAVTQQGSQAPLFANLGALAVSKSLPPALQQAIVQVLTQRTSLDQNLDGGDIQSAFQKSGLFLEASLASDAVLPSAGIPDLKAALIVLRQTLVTSLGATEGPTITPQPAVPGAAATSASGTAPARTQTAQQAPPLAPSSSPEADIQQILLPQARLSVAGETPDTGTVGRIVLTDALLASEPRSVTTGAVLNLLQEALQQTPKAAGHASVTVTLPNGRSEEATVRTNTPPPPFRGSLPSAQAIAAPSIPPNAPLAATAHHLLEDTDAAIARQTLLQVASLPDTGDAGTARLDSTAPRWNFEIPFATPQGTALAQFEISRDGRGNEVEGAKRVWQARFSLDVEPAGPVHALVSFSGERTSVRMWAERPATAAQLRAGAGELSQALSQAELRPGDIVIRDGTPPQATVARAGHFLDRAS
ncbi:MAG: flagellar hook-length control protein FliK [Alphaproteobacteria bacterium]|nr:MAG: flagellar hook-length control protein FliK [Alphaproteobacteria bacterium]